MLDCERDSLLTLLRKTTCSDWCRKDFSNELVRIIREDSHGRLPLTLRRKQRAKQVRNANSKRLVDALSRTSNNSVAPEVLWDYRVAVHRPKPDGNIIYALSRMSKDCDKSAGTLACIQRLVWVVLSVHMELLERTLPNQGNGRLSTAAIADIAEKNKVEATTIMNLATAGRKVTKLMSVFGVFAVLRMDTLSLDFLSKKLSETHIEEAASLLEGSEAIRTMHRCNDRASQAIMVALERLGKFGFDMEAFTLAETGLGNVLENWTRKTLQQLREQSRVSTVAICREGSDQLTSPGQWRPCTDLGQYPDSAAETNPTPTGTSGQVPHFSGLAQPLPILVNAGQNTGVDHDHGGATQHQPLDGGVGTASQCNWTGNTLGSMNNELGDFELLSWNYAFQFLDADQPVSHSL